MDSELENARENFDFYLGQLLDPFPQTTDGEVLARVAKEICDLYRRRGIAELLLEADAAGFAQRLLHSAHAYRWVLEQLDWKNLPNPYNVCTSRAAPFLDAVAAGDFALAAQIASRSAPAWLQDDEYEDDFFYMKALMELVAAGRGPAADAAVRACVAAAPDPDAARPQLALALAAGDSKKFAAAIHLLAVEWKTEVAEQRKNTAADPAVLAVDSQVNVEALALLRLAERIGVAVSGPVPGVPALLRKLGPPPSIAPAAWRTPPS